MKNILNVLKKIFMFIKKQFLGKEEELDNFFQKKIQIELLDKINLSDIWSKSEKITKML